MLYIDQPCNYTELTSPVVVEHTSFYAALPSSYYCFILLRFLCFLLLDDIFCANDRLGLTDKTPC